ncbi:MAG: hypothetical protein NZM00_09050 [Anaerolinea sp.]|nr:hypothetical protein [Anaerolinea sp.]
MNGVEEAIIRTILYADVFSFPLTLDELHHFLITPLPLSLDQVRNTLENSPLLRSLICCIDEYVVWRGHEWLVALRRQRQCVAERLMPRAVLWGRRLARLPFVRMVAITGALSMRNSPDQQDDLDYLIVTAVNRVWLTRLLCVMLVRLGRLRGVTLCPNYVLAENALQQAREDLFMAHEIVQMLPVSGWPIYARLRASNPWVSAHLANADRPLHPLPDYIPAGFWMWVKRGLERLLGGALGQLLERWEYCRKLRRLAPGLATPNHDARLDPSQVKGHFNDHGHRVLAGYTERLRAVCLISDDAPRARLAGD